MTKVLLVEDDKSLREIYAVRLVEEGYDIVSAGDGEEALAMAIKERPGLIISDVMMPKISGFDMLDILRSTTETKNIKVIMMTALSSEDQRERGVSLGADRYLVKSQVGIEDVVRTVHEVLADAPVAGQTPLMASTAPAAVAPPVTPVVAGPGAQISAPATAPTPTSTPSVPPRTATPAPAPRPTVTTPTTPSAPAQAVPTPQPPASPSLANGSTLPQPTAPFSTPRTGTLAGRVIEPLKTSEGATAAPSISTMMEKELSGSSIPPQPSPELPTPPAPTAATAPVTPPPVPPVPPIPVAPIASTPADLSFEETPRPSIAPAPASSATPVAAPQPPVAPGSV